MQYVITNCSAAVSKYEQLKRVRTAQESRVREAMVSLPIHGTPVIRDNRFVGVRVSNTDAIDKCYWKVIEEGIYAPKRSTIKGRERQALMDTCSIPTFHDVIEDIGGETGFISTEAFDLIYHTNSDYVPCKGAFLQRRPFKEVWGRRLRVSDLPINPVDVGVLARYQKPKRHYHNMEHLQAMLDALIQHPLIHEMDGLDLRYMMIAILYHDAIYEPGASNNEERSVNLLRSNVFATLDPFSISRLCIEATGKGHVVDHLGHVDDWTRTLVKLFVDLDLASLAAPFSEFMENNANIDKEMGHLPNYEEGRLKFLQSLLDRKYIFLTAHYRREKESAARDNIQQYIEEYLT